MKFLKTIITTAFLCFVMNANGVPGNTPADTLILQRVHNYGIRMSEEADTISTNAYFRYYIKTDKRNFTLMVVPSMYAISRGNRDYAGETFSNIKIKGSTIVESVRQVNIGTIPHHREAMSTLWKYLKPDIYNVTIFDNSILSPLNINNIKLYKYDITGLTEQRAEVVFHPKRYNTRLISGSAIVDRETGKVIKIRFRGNYDMISFNINVVMGSEGVASLFPKTCDMVSTFHFMGNKIKAYYKSVFDLPSALPDSVVNSHELELMDIVRPMELPVQFEEMYQKRYSDTNKNDTANTKAEDKRWNKVLWDVFGDHLINRTKGNFGANDEGAFRISPILNPLYLGYSNSKGITYKLKIKGSYNFSANSDIFLQLKTGYSFKQKQLYFSLPLRYTFNKKKGGFTEIEIGKGNRITTSDIIEQIKNERTENIDWDNLGLEYFKDFYIKGRCNYDITDKWSVQPGFIYHRRKAVEPNAFEVLGRPTKYYSFAPSLRLQYRPSGKKGPEITTDYERGIKMGVADMDYERFEFDVSWKKDFHSLKSLSLKTGGGFYTSKSKNSYFLDYVNFRDENIPNDWNDNWTGEFQLLNSNWYNASKYYARTNVTYESPLMILSHIPYLGQLMEMERIYMNVLFADHLHPYIECGYGFTNRFFSMGVFIGTSNKNFEGVGCRFGFELFRDW